MTIADHTAVIKIFLLKFVLAKFMENMLGNLMNSYHLD
jgi:hypothetical protein